MSMTTLWVEGGPIKKVTMIVALIGGTAAAIVGVSNAYGVAEPHWIATRYFVRETAKELKTEIITQVSIGDGKASERLGRIERSLLQADLARALENRKTIRTRIASFQADLSKPEMPENARKIIEDQLDRLNDDQADNDRRIDELRKDLARQ